MRWWPLMLLLLLFVWCGLHQRDGVNSRAAVVQERPGAEIPAVAPSTLVAAGPPREALGTPVRSVPRTAPRRTLPSKTVAAPVVPPPEGAIAVPGPVPVLSEPVSFEARTLDGAAFSLQKLRGRVVLVDLISVHCGYCFEELDSLQDLKRRYPELVVVAVAAGDTEEEVHTSLDARDLPFPFPNKSVWRTFPTIRCESWARGPMVLMGDAVRTPPSAAAPGSRWKTPSRCATREGTVLVGKLELLVGRGGRRVPSCWQDRQPLNRLPNRRRSRPSP